MTALPDRMTVIAISQPGRPEVLTPESRPLPQPEAGEILVKVAAAGVNRPDVMQRMGLYPPPQGATDIPGLEIAGKVVVRGSGVTRWKIGDVVMALVVGGGYAEYCVADESHALPVPPNLSPVEAAAVPETFFTVWHNVFERGRLTAGETVLVHGGSSGIGTTAIQLAKAFGARLITTAGSPEKCAACVALGADVAINYKAEDFVAATKKATGDCGANVILDMIGGNTSNATTTQPPSKVASCKSPSKPRPVPMSISAASCSNGLPIRVRRCGRARSPIKGLSPAHSRPKCCRRSLPERSNRQSIRPSSSTMPPPRMLAWSAASTSAKSS
jgi:putative PIG3 family NAD(P)H quinone oxidoreductase